MHTQKTKFSYVPSILSCTPLTEFYALNLSSNCFLLLNLPFLCLIHPRTPEMFTEHLQCHKNVLLIPEIQIGALYIPPSSLYAMRSTALDADTNGIALYFLGMF